MDAGKKEFSNIYEKLLHIQINLKAPKSQYNEFGNYSYRSCEDIQEALKPLLEEVKAVLLLNDEIVQIGDRHYIRAKATLHDIESQEAVSNTAYARETENKPGRDAAQITGSCSSYARKYALNGLFCIDDAKDPDSAGNQESKSCTSAAGKGQRKSGNRPLVTQQHINAIRKEIERTGAKEAAVCYQYKIKELGSMTVQQFKDAMDIFQGMPDKEPDWQQYQMDFEDVDKYADEVPFK